MSFFNSIHNRFFHTDNSRFFAAPGVLTGQRMRYPAFLPDGTSIDALFHLFARALLGFARRLGDLCASKVQNRRTGGVAGEPPRRGGSGSPEKGFFNGALRARRVGQASRSNFHALWNRLLNCFIHRDCFFHFVPFPGWSGGESSPSKIKIENCSFKALSVSGRILKGFACLCTLAVFSLNMACVSQKKAVDAVDTISESSYLQAGYSYLNEPTDDSLFAYVNMYGAAYRNATMTLLKAYAKKQEDLIAFFKDRKDYPRARFYYNNLVAADPGAADEAKNFNKELIKFYEAKKMYGSEKSLRIRENVVLPNDDFYSLAHVQEYRKLLAEIHIERTFESEDKIVRKDDPPVFGSGIIVGERFILTAFHVVEHVFYENTKSYSITVKVQGRTIDNATVLSWDSLSDLAVIKLPESVVLPAESYKLFGNSDTLEQGYDVYCFGHHEGFSSTLTRGIVSAVSRKAPEVGTWIQIDAAIAPGASGGMLIGKDNLIYGLLVAGILFEDINFVVPSNVILSDLDRLLAGETIKRPWLGLLLEETPDKKVSVVYKFPSSPLAGFDIVEYDVVRRINNEPIDSIEKAQKILYDLETGNMVKLSLAKGDRTEIDYYPLLSSRPDNALFNALKYNDRVSTLYPYFGFSIDVKTAKKINIGVEAKIIPVVFYKTVKIRKNSYLENMGVLAGDFIGVISDTFRNDTRFIELIHMPSAVPENKVLEHIYDYVFQMKKGKYEGNIL